MPHHLSRSLSSYQQRPVICVQYRVVCFFCMSNVCTHLQNLLFNIVRICKNCFVRAHSLSAIMSPIIYSVPILDFQNRYSGVRGNRSTPSSQAYSAPIAELLLLANIFAHKSASIVALKRCS